MLVQGLGLQLRDISDIYVMYETRAARYTLYRTAEIMY